MITDDAVGPGILANVIALAMLLGVSSTAFAPSIGNAHRAVAEAGIGSTARGFTAATNIDAAVFVTGLPTTADALSAAPEAHRDFNVAGEGNGPASDMLALAVLGITADLSNAAPTHTTSMSMQIDIDALNDPQHLVVGLLGSQNSNGGFASLRFRLFAEGVALVDQSFSDLAAASAYFGDRSLDLGPIDQGVVGDLDLDLQLDFVAAAPSQTQMGQQRFLVDLAIGNASVGAGVLHPDVLPAAGP